MQGLKGHGMSEEEQVKSESGGFRFDGTIHLGHVLVFLGMVGSVISLYSTFVAQYERVNYRLDSMEKVITDQSQYNKAVLEILNKLQIGQAVTADRLNRLERPRNGVPSPFPQGNDL
jgi:hypothetical protein